MRSSPSRISNVLFFCFPNKIDAGQGGRCGSEAAPTALETAAARAANLGGPPALVPVSAGMTYIILVCLQ